MLKAANTILRSVFWQKVFGLNLRMPETLLTFCTTVEGVGMMFSLDPLWGLGPDRGRLGGALTRIIFDTESAWSDGWLE